VAVRTWTARWVQRGKKVPVMKKYTCSTGLRTGHRLTDIRGPLGPLLWIRHIFYISPYRLCNLKHVLAKLFTACNTNTDRLNNVMNDRDGWTERQTDRRKKKKHIWILQKSICSTLLPAKYSMHGQKSVKLRCLGVKKKN